MELLMPIIALMALLVAAHFAYQKYKVQPTSKDNEDAIDEAAGTIVEERPRNESK